MHKFKQLYLMICQIGKIHATGKVTTSWRLGSTEDEVSSINYSHRLKLCSHILASDTGIHVPFFFCVFLEDRS
jgi:hypothetical protein